MRLLTKRTSQSNTVYFLQRVDYPADSAKTSGEIGPGPLYPRKSQSRKLQIILGIIVTTARQNFTAICLYILTASPG